MNASDETRGPARGHAVGGRTGETAGMADAGAGTAGTLEPAADTVAGGGSRWVLPYGTAARGGWQVAVAGDRADWRHTSLRVAHLAPGESRELDCGGWEFVVVPLSGPVHVATRTPGGDTCEALLAGRPDVFAGPTDIAYVPAGSHLTVQATGTSGARVALAGARVEQPAAVREFRRIAASDVPVERRGAGNASREVRNFGTPGVLDADAIIACEVITPAGNVSSWPPHKHDIEIPGEETALEEIYYCETASVDARGTDPVGWLRVRASRDDRPIDVLAEVRGGDVVLVPHGWHGPAIAAPDAHLYYLNVMAGPGPERAWLISDDPAHAWVRDTWPGLPFDPRLPLPPATADLVTPAPATAPTEAGAEAGAGAQAEAGAAREGAAGTPHGGTE